MTDQSHAAHRPGISRRAGLGLLGAALAAPALAQPRSPGAAPWSTAWTATLQRQGSPPSVGGRTLSIPVRLSVGGGALRLRVSNEFGAKPLTIGAASLVIGGRRLPLAFGGKPGLTLPPGAPALTDPASLTVQALDRAEVRLFLPDADVLAETFQRGPGAKGMTISPPGDFTAAEAPPAGADAALAFLSAMEVSGPRRPGLVIFGDTKSAGPGTWPDFLVELTGGRIAVANRSQYAGLMSLGPAGDSGLARFDRDVLTVAGASHVLIFNGNNDLIQPGTMGSGGKPLLDPALTQSVDQLIAAQAQAATRARAAGLKVVGGTWLPYDGVPIEGYSTPEKAAKRMAVNAWMRSSKAFDLVIDFEAALRDPADPKRLALPYDSGNRFTPSEAGYRRMAEAAWARLKPLA